MERKEPKISCPTFQKQEPIIKEFSNKINEAEDFQHKVELASDLSRCVDMFLSCSNYDANSLDCKNCRFISNLRKKTAGIIIKAKKLSEA